MARPSRCRRICLEPAYDRFAPCDAKDAEQVLLTVDEFEVIRLIDHEKKSHEQCAAQMGISRTTVTETCERARSKLADCLVNGKALLISGGNYQLCDGSARSCCGKKCDRIKQAVAEQTVARKENEIMRIAVTYENGNIFQHFGHTEQFKLYDVEDGRITRTEIVGTDGNGHGALTGMLRSLHIDTLICGGIGGGAQNALAQAGIRLYGGVSGSADDAVVALLANKLDFNPDVHCDHHSHGEGHSCGHHGEGEGHSCGEEKHGCSGSGHSCH